MSTQFGANGVSADTRPTLRSAGGGDAATLARLGAATFRESYAATIPRPAIEAHCARHHVPAAWFTLLGRPGVRAWIVEDGEGEAHGYAVLTPPDLPGATADDAELRRIYVLNRAQQRGVGAALLHAVVAAAGANGAARLLVGVYGRNPAAIGFYRRCGFHQIATRTFMVGDLACDDLVMARRLAG